MESIVPVLIIFIWQFPFLQAINSETRKHCCTLGTNYALNGFECKTFLPEMVGIELSTEKLCLTMVDICCHQKFREMECDKGKKDAQTESVCLSDVGDRKECCEGCQAGIETGKAKEPCTGLGLGLRYDEVYLSCCEEAARNPIQTTTTIKSTPAITIYDLNTGTKSNNVNSGMENICDLCADLCIPVGNTYKCACKEGYSLMKDGTSCKVDKKKIGPRCQGINPCDHDCMDTGTAIECSCREGYKLAEDRRRCIDIDECALNTHECTSKEDCINEIGTYYCYESSLLGENDGIDFDRKCPEGYKYNFDKLVCDDIDECLYELMCVPPKTCKNTIGSFICQGEDAPKCPPGFHYKPSTHSCTDIDECLTGENDCNKESQVCLNTKGNYTCVDKASKNTCPPGFKKNILTQFCEDIDECEETLDPCSPEEDCINEPGGHNCVPKNHENNYIVKSTSIGTTKVPTTTTSTTSTTTTPKAVTCSKGFSYIYDANNCADVNECQLGIHDCKPAERCDNTVGSYLCSRIWGCGTGYTLNVENGLCEDDDECALGLDNCRHLGPNFRCRNLIGSYRCEQYRPNKPTMTVLFTRKPSISTTTSVTSTAAVSTTTPMTTTMTLPTTLPVPTTTTTLHTTVGYNTSSDSTSSRNYPKHYAKSPPIIELTTPYRPSFYHTRTFTYLTTGSTKADNYITEELERSSATAVPKIYFKLPPTTEGTLPYYYPKTTPVRRIYLGPHFPVITGQLKKCLPGYRMNHKGECEDIDECESSPCGHHEKCLNFNGRYDCTAPMQCKIGFELNDAGDQCIDVNECSRETHKCNPSQICKNYQGYYTCECPPGHHFNKRTDTCEDMDECRFFRPCGANADCINTKGSYRCECKEGFRKKSDLCDDIDECKEKDRLCEHNCVNIWGSYRCSCKAGFTLNLDNRTCTDIDECERFKDRRLCTGTCKNVPGSYACECPTGYKLGKDGRGCLDIDECQQDVCASGDVCINTSGSYKCYRIECPQNYIKDTSHQSSDAYSRCKKLQSVCDPRDYQCLLKPEQYTYQYLTLVSHLPLTHGHMLLFRLQGPQWTPVRAEFSMKILQVTCPYGIEKVDETYFQRIDEQVNSMALYLTKSIKGPQEIKLQVEMKLYRGNIFMGSSIGYIIIIVSEYQF